MTTLQDQFCTAEISRELREIGFDEPCLAFLSAMENEYGKLMYTTFSPINNSYGPNTLAAPLWQQAIDHLRIKYNMHIWIESNEFGAKYVISDGTGNMLDRDFMFYPEARTAAILKAIEIVKERRK